MPESQGASILFITKCLSGIRGSQIRYFSFFAKNINTWNKNNNSPRLTVTAEIVAKRTKVFHNQQSDGFNTTTSTSYYVTFEVKSGDRMELAVTGKEYGQMAEGDIGELSFQGTRFLGFERN